MIQDIAPHRLDNRYLPDAEVSSDSLLFVVDRETGEILVSLGEGTFAFPEAGQIRCDRENLIFLFLLDGRPVFMAGDIDRETVPAPFVWRDLRSLRKQGFGPQYMMFAGFTAKQLYDWYADNRFCGRCAQKMVHSGKERALVCPACHKTVYPRLNPAVIVAVTDPKRQRIVVTKYAGREIAYFALIAGFTEIGETLEETVQREVMEEVGLKVKNIRYYKSQPWAMADDILMGFFCEVDGDISITMDANELKEAVWVTRDEMVLQPDAYSLTNEMMTVFKEGKEFCF